jgi:hypothetical protein
MGAHPFGRGVVWGLDFSLKRAAAMTQLVSFTDADSGVVVYVSPLQVVSLRPGENGETAIYLVDQEEPTNVTGAIAAVASSIDNAF